MGYGSVWQNVAIETGEASVKTEKKTDGDNLDFTKVGSDKGKVSKRYGIHVLNVLFFFLHNHLVCCSRETDTLQ